MKVEEFNKNLDNIQQTANELSGTHEIPFAEIFSAEFMQKYSDMDTFDDFLKAGNFCINSKKKTGRISQTSNLTSTLSSTLIFLHGLTCLPKLHSTI